MSRRAVSTPLSLFVDTSAYFALAVRADENHTTAQRLAARAQSAGCRFYTTRYILAETHALIVARTRSGRLALTFLLQIEASRATAVLPVRDADEARAREILARDHDKLSSLVDATSFAVMERLRLDIAFSFDSDFTLYGFTTLNDGMLMR